MSNLFDQVTEEHFRWAFRVRVQAEYGDAWNDLTLREANALMDKASALGEAAFKEFQGQDDAPLPDLSDAPNAALAAFKAVLSESSAKAARVDNVESKIPEGK